MSSPVAVSFVLNLRALPAVAPDKDTAQVARFCRGPELDGLRRAVATELRKASQPRGALIFVSGGARTARVVAEALAEPFASIKALVVPCAGLMTETVEVEGSAAMCGVVWGKTAPEFFVSDSSAGLREKLARRRGTVLGFWPAVHLEGEPEHAAHAPGEVGAGYAENQLHALGLGAQLVETAPYAALSFTSEAPLIHTASACRHVAGPFEITAADGRVVLALDGKPALPVFSQYAGGGRHAGLMLVGLHSQHDPARVLVRPLRGIDPTRKALVLPGPPLVRQKLSFLVRDAQVARAGVEQAAEHAKSEIRGSKPRFGIYLSGAGRGRGLYGELGSEPRALRKSFPRTPIIGLHTSYEVMSEGEVAEITTGSGVLLMFRALS